MEGRSFIRDLEFVRFSFFDRDIPLDPEVEAKLQSTQPKMFLTPIHSGTSAESITSMLLEVRVSDKVACCSSREPLFLQVLLQTKCVLSALAAAKETYHEHLVYYRRSKGLGLTMDSIWLAQRYFEHLQSQLRRLESVRNHLTAERARRLAERGEEGADEYLDSLARSKHKNSLIYIYLFDSIVYLPGFEGCSVELKNFVQEEGPDMEEQVAAPNTPQDQGSNEEDNH